MSIDNTQNQSNTSQSATTDNGIPNTQTGKTNLPSANQPIKPANPIGFNNIEMPAVDPDTAKTIIESRPMPVIWQPPVKSNLIGSTAVGAPSIVELTRALKNDPQLIYEFVYNNIEHVPGFGVAKGALGTLDTNIYTPNALLANSGVPVQVVGTYPNQQLLLSHCWLRVNLGTVSVPNWVVMDPAFKTYSTKTAINLATAMGYSQATFLTQARSGYTIDASGNWVQNVNRANIRTPLCL